jgi:hypothetical protein
MTGGHMRDISASGSFTALAEAIRLNELAKARYGSGSPIWFARSAPALGDSLLPEAATVMTAN